MSIRLEVQDVARSFGGVLALNGVSLTAKSKELLSIIGPNGAGKTTLINAISGVYGADRGKVLLDGDEITRLPAYKIGQRGVGRTFQNIALFRGMTVLDIQ